MLMNRMNVQSEKDRRNMKGFALVLLCIVAAAQARTAVQVVDTAGSSRSLAQLGENPWLVHLRIAVSTRGTLDTCAGALIDQRWVLTTADCVRDARFIWIRYGVVRVVNPELVTETSQVRVNSEANVALISINRVVHSTANIAPVVPASAALEADSAKFCGFGAEDDGPGEFLSCFGVELDLEDDTYTARSEDGKATKFDVGAPLVVKGKLIGILTAPGSEDNAGSFVSTASVYEWIKEETELEFGETA